MNVLSKMKLSVVHGGLKVNGVVQGGSVIKKLGKPKNWGDR